MIKGILMCMLPFYPFYYFVKTRILTKAVLVRFFVFMVPVFIFKFYVERQLKIDSLQWRTENVVNNMSYLLVSLIPYVFLLRKNVVVSTVYLMILFSVIVAGAKRGAIVCASVGVITYFYFQIKSTGNKNGIRNIFVLLISIFVITFSFVNEVMENDFVLKRIEETINGNLSGRSRMYYEVFQYWLNSNNYINLFFGFGFASSVHLIGDYAHNDWLEILSNFGLVGFTFYLLLFISMWKIYSKKYLIEEKRIVFFVAGVLWFLGTFFSIQYFSVHGFMYAILFAYAIGDIQFKGYNGFS